MADLSGLLIEPYGIEMTKQVENNLGDLQLLIEPYGIEINKKLLASNEVIYF